MYYFIAHPQQCSTVVNILLFQTCLFWENLKPGGSLTKNPFASPRGQNVRTHKHRLPSFFSQRITFNQQWLVPQRREPDHTEAQVRPVLNIHHCSPIQGSVCCFNRLTEEVQGHVLPSKKHNKIPKSTITRLMLALETCLPLISLELSSVALAWQLLLTCFVCHCP